MQCNVKLRKLLELGEDPELDNSNMALRLRFKVSKCEFLKDKNQALSLCCEVYNSCNICREIMGGIRARA